MELHDIWKLFLSGNFDQKVRSEPEQFESCWTELVNCDHVHKSRLIVALIAAGVDCDLRNARGLTPVEQALARNDGKLAKEMLLAEADLYSTQRMVYRLVRRGSVPLLETFLELKQLEEGDIYSLISLALEEALVKVVRLTQDMSNYCHKFLLAFFYCSADDTKWSDYKRRQSILNRLNVILKEILFLQGYGTDSFTNIDNEYLQSLKIVTENLYNVDALWRENGVSGLDPCWLWKRLCPQKIIFCFEIFTAVHMQQEGMDLCVLFVDKAFVSVLLEMLKTEIEAIKLGRSKVLAEGASLELDLEFMISESDIYVRWKSKFPKQILNREQVKRTEKGKRVPAISERQYKYLKQLIAERKTIQQIRSQWNELHPKVRLSKKAIQWAIEKSRYSATDRAKPFSEKIPKNTRLALKVLHTRHDGVRTLNSLKKLLAGIEAVKDIPLTEKVAREFGFAAFRKVSLLLGEYTKCTKDTPSLDSASFETATILNTYQVLETYKKQRDELSHGLSLTDVNLRLRRENGELNVMLLQHCESIQEDLRKGYKSFYFIWMFLSLKAFRSSFGRLTRIRSVEKCKSYCLLLSCVIKDQIQFVDNTIPSEPFHNFAKMYAQLAVVMHIGELKNKHKDFQGIYKDIQQAENEMQMYKDYRLTCHKLYMGHVRMLQSADCWDTVKMETVAMLKSTNNTFPNSILILRNATNKLQSIMQEGRHSPTTAKALTLLNRLLVNKEDRDQDLDKFYYHQFLPFQNERYTEDLLTALNIHLNSQQFYSFHYEMTQEVYDPLSNSHVGNVFAVEKKFNVMERLLKKRSISFDATLMDRLRRADERKFQLIFEQMVQSTYDLSKCAARVNDEYKSARDLAVLMGLLEVCQALSHTKAFQANLQYLNTPVPLVVGRYLRNILAHGSILAGSTLFCSEQIIYLTIQVLNERRHQLMNQESYRRMPNFGDEIRKYERRKALLCEQRIPSDLKLDKTTFLVNTRFDIYGGFYFLKREARSGWYNFLDFLVYYYPEDTIAYITCVLNSAQSYQSLYHYLWNRLNHSDLFGSLSKCLQEPSSPASRALQRIAPIDVFEARLACQLRSQMSNILSYCTQMGKFDNFIDYYNRYGRHFQLFDICNSSHPKCVRYLAKIIPWNAVDSENRTWIHLFCQENNVKALEDALKIPAARKLLNKKDNKGISPLTSAANCGYFSIVEIMLSKCDSLKIDMKTLSKVILSHQNNLLKYFLPSLEHNTIEHNHSHIAMSLGISGNVEALRYFKCNLSVRAFQNCLNQNEILYYLFHAKTSKSVVVEFLSIPNIHNGINHVRESSTPLLLDVKKGRFKCINLLAERGAVVDLHVIRAVVLRNSFRWTKRLYKRMKDPLVTIEMLGIIKDILFFKVDIKLLRFFVEQLTTIAVPHSYLFLAIQRRSLEHVRYLVKKFPKLLAQACDESKIFHPFISALAAIRMADSFPRDKQLVMFLLQRCPNILERDDLLLETVRSCDLDTVRYLIKQKIPLEGECQGFTALAKAAFLYSTRKQKFGTLKLLLKHGASVRSLLNRKPEYLGHIHLMETILQETSFDPSEAPPHVSFITNACASGSLRLVKLLVETYNSEITLMQITACIAMDSFEVLRYILTRSKDVGLLKDALVYAIEDGKLKAVEMILQRWLKIENSELSLNFLRDAIASMYAILAHERKQLHVFIYLHSIMEWGLRIS